MVTTSDLFAAFDATIALDESAADAGRGRILACVDALTRRYYPAATDCKSKLTLLGSMAKDTSINPIADADVMFHMPPGTYTRFNDYSGNGQSALLQEVRDALTQRYPSTKIRGDGPVVVVAFSDAPAVEVVPAVLVSEDANILYASGYVPTTRNGGAWEFVDYGAQLRTLDYADGPVGGQLRRLIRYIKAWRKHTGATLKSIVLELMAIEFMRNWDRTRTSSMWDDWLVRDFLNYMVAHYTATYTIPGTTQSIETGYGWYLHAEESVKDAVTACGHEADSVLYRSNWRKVLGDDFGV